MAKSVATSNSILALIFNGTTFANIADNAGGSPLANLYVSLHTGDPGVGGDQTTNEATYDSYGRIAVVRSTSGWKVPASGSTDNNAAAGIVFVEATGVTTNTISHVAIGTDISGTGRVLYAGQLSSSRTVSAGIQPQFNQHSLQISET